MDVQINAAILESLAKRFKAEADGKQYRKDLIAALRQAVTPGVNEVKEKLRAQGGGHGQSPSLGSYLASRTTVQVRTSGNRAGVRIRIPQTPQLRGFKLAARRLNTGSWRHPVYGRRTSWVTQTSRIPGYFDDTLTKGKEQYRRAVIEALHRAAARLSRG